MPSAARHQRLPNSENKASNRGRFANTTIGYVHVDVCELRLAEGKLHMFLAIDRISKFTYVEFHEQATRMIGAAFLRSVVVVFPYKIHTVLTDNGMAFADLPQNRSGPTARWSLHIFDRACRDHGIEHRLTKPYHPWTNGQAERMNRTIKDATVKIYHYPDLEGLKAHILAFVSACTANAMAAKGGPKPAQTMTCCSSAYNVWATSVLFSLPPTIRAG